MSPTQRTLEALRSQNALVGVVERYIAPAKTRIDLFGLFDLVAIRYDKIVGVQCTSGDHHAEHLNTMWEKRPEMVLWLRAGGEIELWSWRLGGPRGKRKVWTERVTKFRLTATGSVTFR